MRQFGCRAPGPLTEEPAPHYRREPSRTMLAPSSGRGVALGPRMANQPLTPDLNDDDDDVIRESSRGGQEPPPELNDTPEQNVGDDEAVKGRRLTPEERRKAEGESPLSEE